MSRGISQKTKKLTVGAILSALGVAMLLVGAMIEVMDLSMAALASFFCIFAVIELGGAYPWLIYAVTSVLSLILMPFGMGGWFYLLFFGYYPIFKEKLERKKRTISWLLKIVLFNVALAIGVVVAYFLFFGNTGGGIEQAFFLIFGGEDVGKAMAIITYLLANIVFVVYDIALTRLITYYFVKIRKKFKFLK
jgi:hypothetical protein